MPLPAKKYAGHGMDESEIAFLAINAHARCDDLNTHSMEEKMG